MEIASDDEGATKSSLTCGACGAASPSGDSFCQNCGKPLDPVQTADGAHTAGSGAPIGGWPIPRPEDSLWSEQYSKPPALAASAQREEPRPLPPPTPPHPGPASPRSRWPLIAAVAAVIAVLAIAGAAVAVVVSGDDSSVTAKPSTVTVVVTPPASSDSTIPTGRTESPTTTPEPPPVVYRSAQLTSRVVKPSQPYRCASPYMRDHSRRVGLRLRYANGVTDSFVSRNPSELGPFLFCGGSAVQDIPGYASAPLRLSGSAGETIRSISGQFGADFEGPSQHSLALDIVVGGKMRCQYATDSEGHARVFSCAGFPADTTLSDVELRLTVTNDARYGVFVGIANLTGELSGSATTTAVTTPQSTSAMAADFRSLALYRGKSFTINYPRRWRFERAEEPAFGGIDTSIRAPGNDAWLIRVDHSPKITVDDPVAASAPVVKALSRQLSYREVDFSRVSFAGRDAVRWEFAVDEPNRGRLHKIDYFFADANSGGWAVLVQAQESAWTQVASDLEHVAESFAFR